MRVAHVNDVAHVGSGLVAALRDIGVEAALVRPRQPGAGWTYPWKVATIPARAAWFAAAGLGLRSGQFDLVHVHYARHGVLGWVAGGPYVIHCHGSDVRGVTPGSPWGRALRLILGRAAGVYFATPDLAPWVAGLRADATFLPNPVALPTIVESPGAERRRDILVGVRLDATKGADSIGQVLESIAGRRPETSVTIIAQGRGFGAVRARAPRDVQVIDPVPHAQMPQLFASHRMAVGQMRLGAIGNYELEGLASGTPLAASFRFPAAYPEPPPVVDGPTPDAVATAILALLDDTAALGRLGAMGRDWVARHHDPRAIARRLLADYEAFMRRP